jgi:uncharacterized protein YceK
MRNPSWPAFVVFWAVALSISGCGTVDALIAVEKQLAAARCRA